MTSRAFTKEEIVVQFVHHCGNIANNWIELPNRSIRERVNGAIFSVLVMLDGESSTLPGFTVTPRPHQDDRAFNESNGQPWYPVDVDIAGGLHSSLARIERVHRADTYKDKRLDAHLGEE